MNSGGPAPLAAGRTVPLEDLTGLWRIEAGTIDLLAVRRGAGRPQGRREILLRLEAGGGLRGGAEAPGVTLLAVGSADLRLEDAPQAGPVADAWIIATAGLLPDAPPGWVDRLAQPGEVSLPAGTLLGCAVGHVLWATVLTDPGSSDAAPPVAVTASAPLRAAAPMHLRLRTTAELSVDELTAALDAHHGRLLRRAAAILAARDAARHAWVAGSLADTQAGLAAGLARLTGRPRVGQADGDAVWRALSQVAAAIGHRLPSQPTGAALPLAAAERLVTHAEAAGIRLRPVLLRDGWWRRDNGPLLAWRGTDPVALWPGWRGYRMFDPATRRVRRLRRQEAADLAVEAVMIYRGFPTATLDPPGLLRHVLRGLRRDGWRLLRLSLAASGLALAPPLAMGILGTTIIPHSDFAGLAVLGGGLLATVLGAVGVEVSRGLLLQRIEARVALDIQAALFDRLLRLPAEFFRRFGSGDLADRTLVMDRMRRSLTGAQLSGALAGGVALSNVAVMLACDPPLGLLGLASALFASGIGLWLAARQARLERRQAEHRGRTENMTLEAIGGVAKLKVAAATERAFIAWLRSYGHQHRAFLAARRLQGWQAVFIAGFLPLATVAVFGLAASSDGAPFAGGLGLGLGAWLAFSCAFGQLMAGVTQTLHAFSGAQAAVPLYARARPILEATLEGDRGGQPPGVLSGDVAFSRVSFAYVSAAAPVLPELSFAIRPGEFVAIVGPSGSGKSTILRLLLGFETPSAGAVLYDGRPLAAMDVAAVRRQVGVVMQNGRLQPGSIVENIGGDRPIELGEAWNAVELAGLAPDIRALPMGMYTMLSEAGGTLSGGQRQRLLIARALARRPRVLLLDEATSALDNRTQSVVAEAVASLGLTRLVVAHRLSTIAAADRILVLDQGRLVQAGHYGDLIAEPGLFREMAQRQLA